VIFFKITVTSFLLHTFIAVQISYCYCCTTSGCRYVSADSVFFVFVGYKVKVTHNTGFVSVDVQAIFRLKCGDIFVISYTVSNAYFRCFVSCRSESEKLHPASILLFYIS
jgi:hypothetical protein